jgi:glyoxylase-like metal-dependent hydrolase (beta-lactamase superfamily II)
MVGPAPESWSVDPGAVGAFEVRPGLWTLRLPVAWSDITHVNAYLLERDDGGVTLVDCGSAGHDSCWDALVTAIGRAGHDVTDVRELVVTHAHSDHFGVARQLVDETGCTLSMHPAHEAFTDGMYQPDRIQAARRRRALREGVPEDLVDGLYATVREEVEGCQAPIPRFRPLHEGSTFETAHGTWVAIETPGHAPNHLVFHQPEARVLLVADLVSRVFSPWFDYGYTEDTVTEFSASLTRAAQLDVVVALPGHGRPIEDFHELVNSHERDLAQRLADTEAAIAAGPTHAYGLCSRVFGPAETGQGTVWQMVEMIAYLRHLRLTGRIVRDDTGPTFAYHPGAGA